MENMTEEQRIVFRKRQKDAIRPFLKTGVLDHLGESDKQWVCRLCSGDTEEWHLHHTNDILLDESEWDELFT